MWKTALSGIIKLNDATTEKMCLWQTGNFSFQNIINAVPDYHDILHSGIPFSTFQLTYCTLGTDLVVTNHAY